MIEFWAFFFVFLSSLLFLPTSFCNTSTHKRTAIVLWLLLACLVGMQGEHQWAMALVGAVLLISLIAWLFWQIGLPTVYTREGWDD